MRVETAPHRRPAPVTSRALAAERQHVRHPARAVVVLGLIVGHAPFDHHRRARVGLIFELGLTCAWTLDGHEDAVRSILAIPPAVRVVALLALGRARGDD